MGRPYQLLVLVYCLGEMENPFLHPLDNAKFQCGTKTEHCLAADLVLPQRVYYVYVAACKLYTCIHV